MIRKILGVVRKQRLFSPGETVVAAVSGGADSVALLRVLHELASPLKLQVVVAHLDHRLRGQESERDALFVAELARSLKLPVHQARRNIRTIAEQCGISLEMAAREARYHFLKSVAKETGATSVAMGHTADDQAETVILRLTRGAGSQGLTGMPHVTEVHGMRVVRPLLSVTRSEILDFLSRRGAEWREDASNADDGFLRNRVRHDILPILRERLNPRVSEALCRTAGLLADEDLWMEALAKEMLADCRCDDGALDVKRLAAHPPAARRRVLRSWLADAGVDIGCVAHDCVMRMDALVFGRRGSGSERLPGGHLVAREYGLLRLHSDQPQDTAAAPMFRCRLKMPGETLLPDQGFRVVVRCEPGISKTPRALPGTLPAHASLSSAVVGRRALYLRGWQPGDRMQPFGMTGSKKLQDIFVDAHVPASARHQAPIVECAGQIVWLPGYRIARGWDVPTGEQTSIQIAIDRL